MHGIIADSMNTRTPTAGAQAPRRAAARLTVDVPAELAGLRLDLALARLLPQYSRSRLQRWIEDGRVQVGGRALLRRDRLLGGERVEVEPTYDEDSRVEAAAPQVPLRIVHRDASLFVIDKPAGLVVHPGAGNRSGTLQNALLALDPGAGAGAARRHRPPARQGHDRAAGRGAHARGAGGAVGGAGRARDRPRVPRALRRHADRRRHRRRADRPASHPAHQDGDPRRRARGRHALPPRAAFPGAYAAARAARDRPHAPDPRAPRAPRASAGRRPGLRRPTTRSRPARARACWRRWPRSSARRCMRRGSNSNTRSAASRSSSRRRCPADFRDLLAALERDAARPPDA